jgi:hypothetical protein
VDISAALAADLAVLTQALDHPGIDLETGLRAFAANVKRAVASYMGLRMTIVLHSHDVSFSVHDDASIPSATSLLIPLAAVTPTHAASTLLLYAATPGAFVDLAADLSFALGIDLSRLVLDGDLAPVPDSTGLTGLTGHFAINKAIGVLIGRGYTPGSARDELHRLAALDPGNLRAVAEALTRDVGREPTDTT